MTEAMVLEDARLGPSLPVAESGNALEKEGISSGGHVTSKDLDFGTGNDNSEARGHTNASSILPAAGPQIAKSTPPDHLHTIKVPKPIKTHSPAVAKDAPAPGARLPRGRCVLVAKCLTNSDASSGRVILPRVAVENNLAFVTGYRHYALPVRDSRGTRYEFVIKSWANGTEHRRVFVLEGAQEYLRTHRLSVGDAIGICTDNEGVHSASGFPVFFLSRLKTAVKL
jgi:hypothetical protein